MAYTKIVFQNSPSTATPLNAENLNHMDDQIALNDQRLTEIETSYVKSFNGRKGDVTAQSGDYNIGQIAPLTGAQVGQVPVVVNHGTEEDPELVFEMGAGGGGGHSIIDSEGNTMPQESAMQFPDSHVSDDSTNGKTVVENVKELTLAELSQATERGMYLATDEESVPIGEIEEDVVSVTADGVKTYKEILNEIYSNADISKINFNSHIRIANDVYAFDGFLRFSRARNNNNSFNNTSIIFDNVSSAIYAYSGTLPISDISNNQPPQGVVIALHYGTSNGKIELFTEYKWKSIGNVVLNQSISINLSEYDEICFSPIINGVVAFNSSTMPTSVINDVSAHRVELAIFENTSYNARLVLEYANNAITLTVASLTGWTSAAISIFAR